MPKFHMESENRPYQSNPEKPYITPQMKVGALKLSKQVHAENNWLTDEEVATRLNL